MRLKCSTIKIVGKGQKIQKGIVKKHTQKILNLTTNFKFCTLFILLKCTYLTVSCLIYYALSLFLIAFILFKSEGSLQIGVLV